MVSVSPRKLVASSVSFLDNLMLRVTGGCGGNGYLTLKGVGGNGGNVVIKANKNVKSLNSIKKEFPHLTVDAANGKHSYRHWLVGEPGANVTLEVPCGVKVFSENLSILGDLVNHDDQVIAAYGGLGGSGINRYFGEPGHSRLVYLDYRTLADISLIGFPNSGKSVLYKKLTKTKPEGVWIKDELFHSKHLNLSTIRFDDSREISCVDLPGLIEGSHQGKGNGNKFLKHIDRNYLIVFVLDIRGYHLGIRRSALETLLVLNKQLELYDDRFLKKPAIIALNKMDLADASFLYEEFLQDLTKVYSGNLSGIDSSLLPRTLIQFQDIIPVSCSRGKNIEFLKHRIRELIDFNHHRHVYQNHHHHVYQNNPSDHSKQ